MTIADEGEQLFALWQGSWDEVFEKCLLQVGNPNIHLLPISFFSIIVLFNRWFLEKKDPWKEWGSFPSIQVAQRKAARRCLSPLLWWRMTHRRQLVVGPFRCGPAGMGLHGFSCLNQRAVWWLRSKSSAGRFCEDGCEQRVQVCELD